MRVCICEVFHEWFFYLLSRFSRNNVCESISTCRCGPIVLSNIFDIVYFVEHSFNAEALCCYRADGWSGQI